MWAGAGGELAARDESTDALRLFDANYNDQGALGGLVIGKSVGG